MFARRFLISFPIFAIVYLIQESVISQFKILGGGFSLFLIFTLLWSALGTPELGALTGFGAGLMMDLSQTTSGPMGQWTLIMILAGFAISYLGYGRDRCNCRTNYKICLFNYRSDVWRRPRKHFSNFHLTIFLSALDCRCSSTLDAICNAHSQHAL